jgi:flagellar biosynthetic protein FliP
MAERGGVVSACDGALAARDRAAPAAGSQRPVRAKLGAIGGRLTLVLMLLAIGGTSFRVQGEDLANNPASLTLPIGLTAGPDAWTSPEGLSSTIQVMLLMTVISLAPAMLIMTTSFIRIVVVLGILRQAIGAQQLPPSQVITSIALFLTLVIMGPVWRQVYDEAIVPYTERKASLEEAWTKGVAPLHQFMCLQIERTGNRDDIWLFLDQMPSAGSPEALEYEYEDVPLEALVPAFILSELKTAFLIGFQIYLPFLILDMVIASVMVSMGMLMLPPVLVSLPFKLLLFVLVDGWTLVVGMLVQSFEAFS